MPRAKVGTDKIVERGTTFLSICVETKNAVLLLLSEGEDQLGTLAVAIPQSRKKLGAPLSSVFLGDRNVFVARALAERIAETRKKISLVSVSTNTVSENEVGPILLKLVEKVISGTKTKKEAEN
jgi:hypothetical protein